MKRGATKHPKMKTLARALGIPIYGAWGIIEGLIHWTRDFAPAGDVGRFENQEIADGCGWDGKPSKLISALIRCGWLDRHEEHRLVVHDWHDHAEDAVHMALARAGKYFATGEQPSLGRLTQAERTAALARYELRPQQAFVVRTESAPALPCPPLPLPSHAGPMPSHDLPGPESGGISRTTPNGVTHRLSGRWTQTQLVGLVNEFPKNLRTGGIKAQAAADAALLQVAGLDEHPGHADPWRFMQGRVRAYAGSWRARQRTAWEPTAWFTDGHYDDPDEAWAERTEAPQRDRSYTAADIARMTEAVDGKS